MTNTTQYGLRDDLLMTIVIQPPRSNSTMKVIGRMRDIVKLLVETDWKPYTMEVDVDEFLESYHSSNQTARKEK